MAESIKGISVIIDGDTTGLSKALAGVNKQSRDIQSELKQVEKLLKLDPTNTELMAQKQQLLTNAVANTQEKLESLKQAQEQVNQQFARGEINEGQYRAFQREIVATEQQLRRYEDQLNNTRQASDTLSESTEQTGDKFKDVGDKVKGAGETMSVAITAPIVAAGGVMLKGALDAQNAQNKLQASLGLTAEEAEKLGSVAKDVWKNGFGETIEEANDAIVTVRKNMGILAEDELKHVTEGAMTIAEVFGAEVMDSTKAAGTMMENFGISGQEALDLITVGFQKGGDYSGELLDTLNEYAPQFAAMGMSADQMTGILISGAQAGAFNLDKVGDAMKEFNIRAQDGSKTTGEGFAAIGLSAEQMGNAIAKGGEDGQKAYMATVSALAAMKDPVAQNTAGVALFGTQWEDVRSQVIVAMADGMKGIGDFKGATDKAAQAMYANNPALALTMALRELQAAIGPALLPLADLVKNTVVPAIKTLAEGFNNLSPAGQKTVLAIAGILAIIGPAMVIIGSLISAVGTIVSVFTAASGVIAGFGGAMGLLTGPIGIAIAIISGLVLAIMSWESIKEFLSHLWTSITSTITTVWEGINQFFIGIWTAITTGATSAWEGIKDTIQNALDAIAKFLQPALEFFQTIIQKAWDIILKVVAGAVLILIDFITGDFTQLGSDIQSIWNNIKTSLLAIWEAIQVGAGEAWKTLKSSVTNLCTELINGVKDLWNGLLIWFQELPGKLKTIGSNMFTSMKDGVTSTITGVKDAVVSGISSAVQWIQAIPGDAVTWGRDIIQGIVNGIKSAASAVENAVKGIAQDIRKFLHFSVPDEGPLTDYESWMPDFMAGLASGIEANKYKVINAIKDLSANMTVGVNPNQSQIREGTMGVGSGLGAGGSVVHSGTIKVEGVNDQGQLQSVVDLIIDKLQMEARMA